MARLRALARRREHEAAARAEALDDRLCNRVLVDRVARDLGALAGVQPGRFRRVVAADLASEASCSLLMSEHRCHRTISIGRPPIAIHGVTTRRPEGSARGAR